MKRTLRLLCVCMLLAACKENYDPPATQTGVSALVVDGFLNNSTDTTFIRLSHTNKLAEGIGNSAENAAQLFIEDANGNTIYNFQHLNDNGLYVVPGMNLAISAKYRLRILLNNQQYLSDELAVLQTPPIDSISFEHTGLGVNIGVNAHDPSDNTRYYRWEYTETYQYHAAYFSGLIFEGRLRDRLPSENIYDCWKTQNNTQILTGSTARLSHDVLYHNTVRFIKQDGLELSEKYFIALRQFALTRAAFEYYENLKKITEQTGSIFDAQPSQLLGNIHAVNDPGEIVIAYLTASTQEKMQVYISNSEVQPWDYRPDCALFETPIDPTGEYISLASHELIPISYDGSPLMPKGVFVSSYSCSDCRAFGGATTKPAFWP